MIGIYALRDPRTQEIRYVGQSIDIERRYKYHLSSPDRVPSSFWIKKLGRMGLIPALVVLEESTLEQLDVLEMKWILVLRERMDLLNCGDGGHGGPRGHTYTRSPEQREVYKRAMNTPEMKEKMRQIALVVQNRPETRQKRSESLKGKPKSEEHRQRIRESLLGKTFPLRKKKTHEEYSEHSRRSYATRRLRRAQP